MVKGAEKLLERQIRARFVGAPGYSAQGDALIGYAKQAVKTAADARSDLLKVIQAQDPAVGEHSSVAAGALAQIESRLASIDPGSLGAHAAQGIKGLMVGGAFLADTVIGAGHVAHLAQTFANGYDSVDGHPATSQEIRLAMMIGKPR